MYRVFSRYSDNGRRLGLIRYWQEQGRWFKPPKYGAEHNHPECLTHYNCATVRPAIFGLTLAAAQLNEVDEYYNSVSCFQQALGGGLNHLAFTSVCKTLERLIVQDWGIPVSNIGLTGSLMIGAHRATSDLDLVIYLDRSASSIPPCFRATKGVLNPLEAKESTMLARFFGSCKRQPADLAERAIFSARVQDLKVDFHYARATTSAAKEPLPEMRPLSNEMNFEILVESAEERHLYPGISFVKLLNSDRPRSAKLVCLDHSGHFLLRGDVVELSARIFEVTRGNADFQPGELVLVCQNVYSIVPSI
jgi:hypothetical protein